MGDMRETYKLDECIASLKNSLDTNGCLNLNVLIDTLYYLETVRISNIGQLNELIKSLNYNNENFDTGEISDNYHTFNDLYFHRMILFKVICELFDERSWKSRKHHDGTMYENYFIVGIDTDIGQYTYHYHEKYWEHFCNIKEIRKAPEWDGHKPEDIERMNGLICIDNRIKYCLACDGLGVKIVHDEMDKMLGIRPKEIICFECNGTGLKNNFKNAMTIIKDEFKADKTGGSMYYVWQSNLACLIADNTDVNLERANEIACKWLNRLIEDEESE